MHILSSTTQMMVQKGSIYYILLLYVEQYHRCKTNRINMLMRTWYETVRHINSVTLNCVFLPVQSLTTYRDAGFCIPCVRSDGMLVVHSFALALFNVNLIRIRQP